MKWNKIDNIILLGFNRTKYSIVWSNKIKNVVLKKKWNII